MENCKLPRDMVVDILLRLPVKSLMRFKCVSKFFYDLIKSDHHFMNKHYEISKAKTDCVLLEAGWDAKQYYLLYKESEDNEIGCIYLDIPRTPTSRVVSVKSCKGMLCLISTKDFRLKHDEYLVYDILIWNPSIRKAEVLPSVTVPYRAPCDAYVYNHFGFGISNNMTWKVVILLDIRSLDGSTIHQITMVYSKDHSDSWSLRQINPVISCRDISFNDFYLKGRHYWRAVGYYDDDEYFINDECLIWFDMNDEVFGTIELPSNLYTISIMNETIALLVGNSKNFVCIDIWLMIENDDNTNWRYQASIDCAQFNIYNNLSAWTPIGIWNVDGELLAFVDFDWDGLESDHVGVPYFVSLDLVTQERKVFSLSKERKSITMASNSTTGHFQVYNERNIDILEEWKHNIFDREEIYARVYYESLHSP
ncbi:putative F-box protein At3g47150 [Ipomoea triloba]|uniref:putative F-box protein At3g47150 n=1 Tax=Ipomoea triloba TaxID=35885 RepID=UPI00125DE5AC|nr:putative F-box protein At3g47150 [Ipomoea triloba]